MTPAYVRDFGNMPAAGNRSHTELLAELRAAKKELDNYAGLMTAYESHVIQEDIKARVERYRPAILGGVLAEWDAALEGVTRAKAQRVKAVEEEARRWDGAKLGAELSTARQLVELTIRRGDETGRGGTTVEARLRDLMIEASNARDLHRWRAILETVAAVSVHEAGTAPGAANRTLPQVRDYPAIHEADEALHAAAQKLTSTRAMLQEAGELLGEPVDEMMGVGPLAKAARRVQVDRAGNVHILAPDDPAVTGVVIHDEVKNG